MFKFFFGLVAVSTIASMGIVGKIGSKAPAPIKPAPVLIDSSGSVSFPGRVPSPDTVYELRRAIQMEDVETMNEILVQNHLFVAPGE